MAHILFHNLMGFQIISMLHNEYQYLAHRISPLGITIYKYHHHHIPYTDYCELFNIINIIVFQLFL
jgi:hypothetical protein